MLIYKQNGASFRVYLNSKQGGRKYMEDVPVVRKYTSENEENNFLYFAVFDGHGGAEAANFARDHLLIELKEISGFWTEDKEQISTAIKEAFLNTHKQMWKSVGTWPKTGSGLPSTAGTTASVVVIKGGYMYIAHVGDSSIVLGEENYWHTLQANCVTVDHKPESQIELKRIEESGGRVMCKSGVPRVVWHRPKPAHKGPIRRSTPIDDIPFLAVARALGDLWSYNAERDKFVVSPEPDLTVCKFDPAKHKFIIIASDGLWNMVKPEESVGYVEQLVEEAEPFTHSHNPAQKLVQLALNKWAIRNMRADNTTVIVVMVDAPSCVDTVSRSASYSSNASTVKLESDSDIVTDQEIDISANVEVKVLNSDNSINRNALPPIRPSPHHIGFFRHHPKHINSYDDNSWTPTRSHPSHHHRPSTPGSVPNRCHSHYMTKVHRHTKEYKHRRHSFWASSIPARPGDKVIIPTMYKSPEEQAKHAKAVAKKAAVKLPYAVTPGRGRKPKMITPTKFRSPEDQEKKASVAKRPIVSKLKWKSELGDSVEDLAPEENLPLLNTVIIPSIYKSPKAAANSSCGWSSQPKATVKKPTLYDYSMMPCPVEGITKISPLNVSKPKLGSKRKASLSLDCSNISSKKMKHTNSSKSESSVESTDLVRSISNDSGFLDSSSKTNSPKIATSAQSPVKVSPYPQPSPSTAAESPVWPKDIDMDTHTDIDPCNYAVSGSQVCRPVLRENPVMQNCEKSARRSYGTQNHFTRSGSMRSKSKPQVPKINVRNLRLRSKRPSKLRNSSHRTRLQVKGNASRKS